MNSSAIPSIADAVLAQLEGHTAGAPWVEGKPEPMPAEAALLWEVSSTSDYASLGQQKLHELVSVTLVVESLMASGKDFAPPRQRAQEIAGAMEAGFRADLTLGGAWQFGRVANRKQQYFRADKQRGCRIFLTLSGQAEI